MKKKQAMFCSLECAYAELPRYDGIDGSGSCHTFTALYCNKLGRHVAKGMRCIA